jgi:HK97 family phage major capsid protein
MPVLGIRGNQVFVGEREASKRLAELRARDRSQVSPVDGRSHVGLTDPGEREELAALEAYYTNIDRLWSRAGVSGALEGVDPARTGYGQAPPEHDRTLAPGAYSQLYNDTIRGTVDRAHRLVDRLHTRGQVPDRGAQVMDRMLRARSEENRWRAGEMINLLASDEYAEAFFEALKARMTGFDIVTGQTQDLLARGRAMAIGTGAAGGFAVPFQLDPTIQLTSSGAIDPIRRIARVEVGQAKEFDLVTSAGVVAGHALESTEASDNSPTLAQPNIKPVRTQAFVPFSIELDTSWSAAVSELTKLLTDAASVIDAQDHITGNGTAPNTQGILTGMAGQTNEILTNGTATLTLADLYAVQAQVPPRFRSNDQTCSFVASLQVIQLAQQMQVVTGQSAVQGAAQSVGNYSETGGPALTLLNDPLYEASFMDTTVATGKRVAVAGDFHSGYVIYDVLPTRVELIPHLFGATNRYPTGQRGLYFIRLSGAQVINPSALAVLKVR